MDVLPEMIRAYEAAIYVVRWPGCDRRITFGQILTRSDIPVPCRSGFAIVTAANPFSRPTPPRVNELRYEELCKAVGAMGYASYPSEGRDPKGVWLVEHGLAIMDVSLPDLDALMMRFGQNAVLDVPLDNQVRLMLHPEARRSLA